MNKNLAKSDQFHFEALLSIFCRPLSEFVDQLPRRLPAPLTESLQTYTLCVMLKELRNDAKNFREAELNTPCTAEVDAFLDLHSVFQFLLPARYKDAKFLTAILQRSSWEHDPGLAFWRLINRSVISLKTFYEASSGRMVRELPSISNYVSTYFINPKPEALMQRYFDPRANLESHEEKLLKLKQQLKTKRSVT